MAHGMLLPGFLSPATNHRTDQFGGGIVAEEAARLSARLVATGLVDYVSVTAGNNTRTMARVDHWQPTPAPLAAFRHLSRAVKAAVDVPVATVGRATTYAMTDEILASGDADLVGMVRAHVADPALLPKSVAGQAGRVLPCVGANVCVNALLDHRPLACMVNPDIGRPLSNVSRPDRGAHAAVVVGGAAPCAAGCAHGPVRGGGAAGRADAALVRHAVATGIPRHPRLVESVLPLLQVQLRPGTVATPADLIALNPSLVVLATGSRPMAARLPGIGPDLPAHGPYDVPSRAAMPLSMTRWAACPRC